jgi:hypothetical protein
MVILFNASLEVEDFKGQCPRIVYDTTKNFIEEKGLVGMFNINHYGLIKRGCDISCNQERSGKFFIHYKEPNDNLTMREHFENDYFKPRLDHSEDKELSQEILEKRKKLLEEIEKRRPLSRILSEADFLGSDIPQSIGINTPAGRQSLHYHMNDNMHFGVMQLFRPKKEDDYYCLDILKDYIFDLEMYKAKIDDELISNRDLAFHKRSLYHLQKQAIKRSRCSYLFDHLFLSRFDEVKRIPFLLKHLDFLGINANLR